MGLAVEFKLADSGARALYHQAQACAPSRVNSLLGGKAGAERERAACFLFGRGGPSGRCIPEAKRSQCGRKHHDLSEVFHVDLS